MAVPTILTWLSVVSMAISKLCARIVFLNLDHKCRMQQVGEGWFATVDDVPKQAISMLPKQIMACKVIVSVVPHSVKAKAVYDTITQKVNNMVPATLLKTHPEWYLYIDDDAASMLIK